MSVVSPRSRVVYFRLSESEFSRLASMCRSVDGERSVSELVRTAVFQLLASANDGEGRPDSLVGYLDRQLAEVNQRLDEVLRLLGPAEYGDRRDVT